MAAESVATVSVGREGVSRRRQLLADGTLVGMTAVWGASFVLVKDVVERVTPLLWLSVRFALGALALALVAALARRWRGMSWREVRWGALIGVFLWAGYALQTLGLQGTSASNGGFITGLSVVLVPIFGLFMLRQKPHRWATLGVIMATLGLAFLSLHIEAGIRVSWGDALVFGCAIAFAVQIVLISHVAGWADPVRMTLVQVTVAALLNAVGALVAEKPVAGLDMDIWIAAAFLGVVATAIAILLQSSVQRYTSAVHVALIFTLEPVFAAAFGAWLQGDRFGPIALAGAVLILTGMLVAELGPAGWELMRGQRA
jgi:drug/metabolite transporter (DMT)-like permease